MAIFLQAFLDGFTGGSLLSWADMPGSPNQVFADESSDYPQFELMKSLLKEQQAKEGRTDHAPISNDEPFQTSVSATQTFGAKDLYPDVVLVERARAGDIVAFDKMIMQYEIIRKIFQMALRSTQEREDAELEQEKHGT